MIALFHYKIPFQSPFRTSKGVFRFREGFILDAGQGVRTEIAPLPGFSMESQGEVLHFLQTNIRVISRHYDQSSLDTYLSDISVRHLLLKMPSVRFGLSMLNEQQKASVAGMPLYTWLIRMYYPLSDELKAKNINDTGRQHIQKNEFKSGFHVPPVRSNAVIGLHETEELLRAIARHQHNGFSTVKVKLPSDWRKALTLIPAVCEKYPGILFRFDANGAYSEHDARQLLQQLQSLHQTTGFAGQIDYLEEPLNRTDLQALAGLRQYGFRIAVDESVRSPFALQEIIAARAADVVVVKPMLFGSMPDIASVWDVTGNKIEVTISSSLESIVGRKLLTHIAAFVNSLHPTDHGLATGELFAADLPFSDNVQVDANDWDSLKSAGVELIPVPC